MQRDDCRYRLSDKTAAKKCWGDPNNPTGRAKMRGNSILLNFRDSPGALGKQKNMLK